MTSLSIIFCPATSILVFILTPALSLFCLDGARGKTGVEFRTEVNSGCAALEETLNLSELVFTSVK